MAKDQQEQLILQKDPKSGFYRVRIEAPNVAALKDRMQIAVTSWKATSDLFRRATGGDDDTSG